MVNVAVDIPGATNDRSVSENTLQDTHALQSSTRKSRQSSLHHRLTMNDTWIFILTNPATDQLVAANHAFYQILGFEQKTVIGRTTVELKLFADIHQRNVSLAKLQKEEIGDALATTIRSADGREKFCIETTELVHLQGQSYAATLLQLAVDSNMTLFAADDERFNKVFSSTPNIAIQGYSADGSIHYWNAASERLYGYSAEEAVGKNLVELIIPQEMRDVVRGMISAGAETGIMPPAAELMLQHKNGDSVPVYSSHVVVFLPEKPPEFYCIDVDLKTQWLREQRLGRITSLLLNLEQDAQKNFQRILDLCGELLGADCALYNRLDGDLLCLISGWNAPSDIQEQDDPQGHLCFDVISRKEDGVLCVRNLQNTIYSQTDPNVAKYGLQTYIGHPVRFGGKNQGSLCVVFTRDVEPTAEDLTILGLLASALAQEEERLQAHQELIERDQFEKVLIDHVLAGVALVDAETLKVEKINPAARAMLGLQEDQVIEDLCQKFFCSSDDGLCPLKDIGITVDNAECELQRADGKRLHVQKSVQRVKIQGKEKFVECFVDISSHKNIQKILQQERDLLERASVAGQVALWDWDVKHNILDWTSYIDSLLKYPADGFPRTLQAWEDALHPNDHSRVVAALQEHAEKGTLFDVIYRIQDANGDYRWWHDVGQAILDEAGKPTRMLGACVDVTEKHLAEELMVESRQMLLSVLDTIPVRVFWKDLNLKYLGCNKSFVKDAGYDAPQEVIGLDDYQMGWKDQAHIYRRDDFSVIESGVAKLNYEEPQTSPAGETLFLRTSKIPLRDANQQIKGILGTYEDITEEKKSEAETMRLRDQLQQAQKIESVGRLAGGVAHDFNNMLGVILGHVEMALQQAAVGHPLHQHLDGIRRAAQRSADLTRQLLAFARRQTIQPKAIDLNVALTGMQKMLERLIGEDVELQWNLGKELWMVCIDPVQIDQVLANLIVNARDALAGHGSIITGTTNITIRGDDKSFPAEIKPGDYVMLSVFDSGKGISPEALEHIFEPFYTTKGVGNGTGLGLSVIYGIVKQNNGYIDVKSKSDKGTLFRIFLPRFDSLITPIDKSPEVHAPRKGRETILLVEDEQMILDLGEAVLLEQGYQVLTASTPQEALDRVQHYEGEIELLITDVIMPLMNGKELKEKLLLSRPHLQCLFMSGYTADIIAHSGALDKDVHFIQKPFTVQSFANVVRQILDSGNSPLMNVKT